MCNKAVGLKTFGIIEVFLKSFLLIVVFSSRADALIIDNSSHIIIDNESYNLYGNRTYEIVEITNSGILYVAAFNGTAGTGYLNLSATRYINISINGKILGGGKGYTGGSGGGFQGSGSQGSGTGSGNGGAYTAAEGRGGGGGGHGGAGGLGNGDPPSAQGGGSYGSVNTIANEIGSGGGGGQGGSAESCGIGCAGGNGGASVYLKSQSIRIQGLIDSDGGLGSRTGGCTDDAEPCAGGGGGSGGQVIFYGTNINISLGSITANGGSGAARGGDGGGGRIKIFYGSLYNTSATVTVAGANAGTIYYEHVDTTAPAFSNHQRNPNSPNEDQTTQINVTLSETPDAVILELDNGTHKNYTVSSSQGFVYYFTINTGNYTAHDSISYKWYANDSAGNSNRSDEQSFVVANQKPITPSLIEPSNSTYSGSSVATAWTTSSDSDNEDIVSYWLYTDGTANKLVTTNSTSITFSDGAHYVQLRSTDGYDNSTLSGPVYFTVDTTPPAISIHAPGNSTIANSTPLLNVTFEEIVDAWYRVDTDANSSPFIDTRNLVAVLPTLSDGSHSVTIYANDSASNLNSSTMIFTIDTVPPIITFSSPKNRTYGVTLVLLNISTSEDAVVTYSLNGAANESLYNGTTHGITTMPVNEGASQLTVYARDAVGNLNSSVIYFAVDTTPPVVRTLSPLNQTYGFTSVWVNVTLSDETGNVTALLDGVANYSLSNSSGNWTGLLTGLSDGVHNVRIFANDSLGNMNSSLIIYFTIDTTAPAITIQSPTNTTFGASSVWLNVTLNEDDGVVYALLNGTNYSLTNSSGNWNFLKSGLSDGWHIVKYFANDSVGNGASSPSVNFSVDTTQPRIIIASPLNVTYEFGSGVTLAYSSNEPTSSVYYSLNDGGNTSFVNGATTITLSVGMHSMTIWANDSLGHWGSNTTYFTVADTTPPRVENTSSPNIESGQDAEVTADASDLSGISTVLVEYDGVVNQTMQLRSVNKYNATVSKPSLGVHGLRFFVSDTYGNTNASVSSSFTVSDTTPPAVMFVPPTPSNDANLSATSITINVSHADLNPQTVILSWNGVNESYIYSGAYTNITQVVGDGVYSFYVWANDTSGNRNITDTRTLRIDATKPTLTLTSPWNISYAGASMALNISATETISTWRYSLNGAPNITFAPNTTITAVEGMNTLVVWANDSVGNMNYTTVQFTVDSVTPSIGYAESTTNNTLTPNDWIFLNITVDENSPDTVIVQWDNGSIANYSMSCLTSSITTCSRNFTGQQDGAIEYKVFVNDSAGNARWSEGRTARVDTMPPLINIATPSNVTYAASNIGLNYSILEQNLNATHYSLDYGLNMSLSGNATLILQDGRHRIDVHANDSFGRNSVASAYFIVDTTPPVFDTTSPTPLNGSWVNKNWVYINFTSADATSSPDAGIVLWNNGSSSNYSVACNGDGVANCGQNFTGQADGWIAYRVFVNDTVGNANWSAERVVRLDSTLPSIAILSPSNTTYNRSALALNFTVSEANLDWSGYALDGGFTTPMVSNTSLNLSEGFHALMVYVNDSAGNNASASVYFTIDTTPPYCLDLHLPNNTNTSSSSITLNWTACDAVTSMLSEILLDGEDYANEILTQNCTVMSRTVDASEGAHNLTVIIRDVAGNTNASTIFFAVDASSPTLENATATPADAKEGDSVELVVQARDSLTGVSDVWAELTKPDSNGSTLNLTNGNGTFWRAQIGVTDVGTHTVVFYASDYAGNSDFSPPVDFEVKAKSNPSIISRVAGGGGGGWAAGDEGCLKLDAQSLNSSIVACMLKELDLKNKRFYTTSAILAPALALTGDKTGDYPVPDFNISGHVSKPILKLDWDAYEVAAKKGLAKWPNAKKVVIARGDIEADAYAAIAYAKIRGYPLLLTKPKALPSITLESVGKIRPEGIVIVGGSEAISKDVERELGEIAKVERIAGRNREETAVEVAEALMTDKKNEVKIVVIADGDKPSPGAAFVSAAYGAPILYTSRDDLPTATRDFLAKYRKEEDKEGGALRMVFVGVGDRAKAEVNALLALK